MTLIEGYIAAKANSLHSHNQRQPGGDLFCHIHLASKFQFTSCRPSANTLCLFLMQHIITCPSIIINQLILLESCARSTVSVISYLISSDQSLFLNCQEDSSGMRKHLTYESCCTSCIYSCIVLCWSWSIWFKRLIKESNQHNAAISTTCIWVSKEIVSLPSWTLLCLSSFHGWLLWN